MLAAGKVENMKGHLSAEQLKEYSYKDLQALAKDMGVNASGKAEEIIARIVAVEVDAGELTEEEKAIFDAEAAAGQPTEQPEEKEAAAGQTAGEAEDTAGEPQPGQETEEKDKAAEIIKEAEKAQEEADRAAGRVKVEAVTRYLDQQFNQIKEAGEVFTVNRERAAVLLAEKVVKIKE